MRGEIVFVREGRGKPLVRRVWEVTPTTVYICTEERYQRLLKDFQSEFPPTGFPIEDVYEYNPMLEKELTETYQSNPSVWEKLKPYSDRLARR
jgi:hypothetical protein